MPRGRRQPLAGQGWGTDRPGFEPIRRAIRTRAAGAWSAARLEKHVMQLLADGTRILITLAILGGWCAMPAAADDAKRPARKPISGILYNEDDSNRFVRDPAGKMKPERLDKLVDELADSQVTIMLICCCAK